MGHSLIFKYAVGVILLHIIIFIFFAVIRMPLLNNYEKHYCATKADEMNSYLDRSPLNLLCNSMFQSLAVQTGWGASHAIVPKSVPAKLLHMIQTAISFLITTGSITLVSASLLEEHESEEHEIGRGKDE